MCTTSALRRGDEALQRDTRGMFRFNPGIEGKSVPDYNPYTLSKCPQQMLHLPRSQRRQIQFPRRFHPRQPGLPGVQTDPSDFIANFAMLCHDY